MKNKTLLALLALMLILVSWASAACTKAPSEVVEPIVIGAPCSLGYPVGRDGARAAQLAVEEINANGGVSVDGVKRPFDLVTMDIRDMAPGVPVGDCLLGYENLILNHKPQAIVVGPGRSEVMLAAMDVVAKYKIPHLGSETVSPSIPAKTAENYERYKYCFEFRATAVTMANSLINMYKYTNDKFGFNKKIYFIPEDAMWARATADIVREALEKLGWEVQVELTPLGTTDYSMPLSKARDFGAQIIGVLFSMPEVGILLEQAYTMKIPALIVGVASQAAGPTHWDTYEGKVESSCMLVTNSGAIPVRSIPRSVEFFDAYVERWGDPPELCDVVGGTYDSVYILAQAIERAGTLDPDALVNALEQTNYKGAIGRVVFGKEDHQVIYGTDPNDAAVTLFIQWQQPGRRVPVWPPEIAEAELQLPPWMR